jgi:hypothetical protein
MLVEINDEQRRGWFPSYPIDASSPKATLEGFVETRHKI